MRQPFYKKWVSFTRNSVGAPEILDTNNYYPFGLNHIEGPWASAIFGNWSSYKFGGKELQETGMFDFGARFYMPDLGRWGVIDPLAETSRRFTPYNYAYNNPISFIDPDGRKAMNPDEERMSFASGGALEYNLSGRSGSFSNFLGFDDPIDALNRNVKRGGGSNKSESRGKYYLPNFSQFNFSQIADNITVDKDGKVINIVRNKKPNRFFDESGMQLFFNDSESVDKNARNKKYDIGDQVYYQIDWDEFLTAISKVSKNDLIINLLIQAKTGDIVIAPSAKIAAYGLIVSQSVMGDADFSAHYLSRKLDLNGINVYQNDSSYHFRFGNTNTIYSLMDAGNFMWGGWSRFIGLTTLEVYGGSNLNEIFSSGRMDTPADQRSVFNGRKFLTNGK